MSIRGWLNRGVLGMTFLIFNRYPLAANPQSGNVSHSTYENLCELGLIKPTSEIKLNVGCGEVNYVGYINIDLPFTEHTVQSKSGADYFIDIRYIQFPESSISEIRGHHIFENFNRPQALALLCAWTYWLKEGGKIHLETPDFEKSASRFLDEEDYENRQIILRHIFGSHEASWGVHFDGWYQEKFEHVMKALGYESFEFTKSGWELIDNLTIEVHKKESMPLRVLRDRSHKLLKESMVTDASSEWRMWEVWCEQFDDCLSQMVPEVREFF